MFPKKSSCLSTQKRWEPQRRNQIQRNLRVGQIELKWWTRWPHQLTNIDFWVWKNVAFGKTLRLEKRYFFFQIELEYTFGNAQSDESRDEGSLRFIRSVSKVKSRRDRKKPRMKPEIWGLSRLAHISILAYCRFYVWCNMTDDTIQDCFNGKVNESGLAIVGLLKII